MKYRITGLIIFLFTLNANSQCNPETTQMMVVGDSWAFFSWTGDSYNENLDRFGMSDIDCFSNLTFAVNGAEASDYFDDSARVQDLEDYIIANPDLAYVHYSLGGNDAMGSWNKNMTPTQTSDILDIILDDIKNGIDTLHSFNPNLKIIISGYDYPNFSETVGTLPAIAQPLHPFYGTWNGMGQPNAAEINGILTTATNRFIDSSLVWPNVFFFNNLGLMQYEYGQTTNLTVAPFGTYPANTAPLPGGFPDYPSPLDALNFGGNDSFHLNDNAFELFIKGHFEQYYWNAFRDAHLTITSDASSKNGWISSMNEMSNEIVIGNDNNENKTGILHFDTSPVNPNLTIDRASIFIKRDSLMGANLINEDLTLSIKSDFFGATDAIESDDYADLGDANSTVCTYGTLEEDGYWMRIDIPTTMWPFINSNGSTQFKLNYNITDTDRHILFDNTIDQAQLDIHYTQNPSANISDNEIRNFVYPNPTYSSVFLNQSVDSFEILELTGKVVRASNEPSSQIDFTGLPEGIYFLKTHQSGIKSIFKIVKK